MLFGCAAAAPATPPVYGYRIVHTYPHDTDAFTEGLFYLDGHLYESTGLNGRSEIREEKLEDGKVLRSVKVDPRYFGEGIVDWGPEILSLTWQGGVGFRWRRSDFAQLGEFHYPGEGWALTRNGTRHHHERRHAAAALPRPEDDGRAAADHGDRRRPARSSG